MPSEINPILERFEFMGEFITAEPYGNGHIHDTFALQFANHDGNVHRYILQRVNHHVFKDPQSLIQNILAVTTHLREKIIRAGRDPQRETLTPIPTRDGQYLQFSERGEYWRAYDFIENAQTYQFPVDHRHVYHAGKAYGDFQKQLADFPAESLIEPIRDFHNTPKRFENLMASIKRDPFDRVGETRDEIAFAIGRENVTSILVDKITQGDLPQRVTHNDTKFNNVMLDNETGEGVCVIDLDTVMPGLSLYDFGDAIRSITNKAPEDRGNLSGVGIDLHYYEHFTRGFLDAARGFLTHAEIDMLPLSALLMTLESGFRFLTDYLEGDVYFKIHRDGHNLDRCRNQFKLVRDMEDNFQAMTDIVDKYRY
ncbi:MAG: aminoglycoside phosphotransferase family protein [Anaerolineales bacterium]|jgi:Ser/Thr protein kinase RdoA (MazF antagonist)